ncbi:uncharacterized protein LOC110822026 [Carica papaya]|uniref:uncharacterized protein LOC110822026 n=1 Tax=Carica papaya TaxID=3649 RepID=UPI000B8D1BC1|nr:uncharacterized protein LOC110822026 [Carica papaya]
MIYYGHSQSTGSINSTQQMGVANGPGNDLANVAVQGFVEGAAQQVGQSFVQNLMGDGNGGGNVGDNNCNGDASGTVPSVSVISVGSSILSGVFGDSENQN